MPIPVNNFQERSFDVQELITRMPSWMVRSGTIVIAALISIIIFGSWIVKYPDVVSGTFKLSGTNVPKGVFTKTDGKLIRLFVKNGSKVSNGQVLAYLESTANHKQVLDLDTLLGEMYKTIANGGQGGIKAPDWKNFEQLGELQMDVQTFGQSLVEFISYQQGNYYAQKKRILQTEIQDLQLLAENLKSQQQFQDRDRQLAMEEYATQQKLAAQRVIAPNELKQAESRKLSRLLPSEQSKAFIIQNNSLREEKKKELLELDNQALQHRASFVQRVNTLRSAINNWKNRHLIIAPLDGVVYFSTVVQENQYLAARQQVFNIAPPSNGYLGELHLSQQNFGKVKIGQEVIIKFASYPFEQFGHVSGKITDIAEMPVNDSLFLVRVSLPNGLTTVYNNRISYKAGLSASAEIITEDMRLLERIFYNMRKSVATR